MKVAIVGGGENGQNTVPWADTAWEIWSLNQQYLTPGFGRWDRWFQMHPKWEYARIPNRKHPDHYQWLKSQTKPIVMQDIDPLVPASVAFPLQAVESTLLSKLTRQGIVAPVFTSTFEYMVALALRMGASDISIHGFLAQGSYVAQAAGVGFWVGLACARCNVLLPPGLLEGGLYGYDVVVARESYIRERYEVRAQELGQQKHDGHDTAELEAEVDALRWVLEVLSG